MVGLVSDVSIFACYARGGAWLQMGTVERAKLAQQIRGTLLDLAVWLDDIATAS
jgi:hypothetical protein